MISVKVRKIIGDLKKYKSRFAIMIIALAVSLFAVAVIMTTTSILSREIEENYVNTEPAHATFEVSNMTKEVLEKIRLNKDVKIVEMRDMISMQILSGNGEWYGLRLFIIEDFENLKLSKIYSESGAWPPAKGEFLFERTVPEMLSVTTGDSLKVKTALGETYSLKLSGIIHDPSLSPAWQEKTGYSYATVETMEMLTGWGELHDLKVVFNGEELTQAEIKIKSLVISDYLISKGITVHEIMVPPPYRHPHQGQMESILSMLMIFGYLAIFLSAILAANMISALLAREIKQIGILKTIGADSTQILGIYFIITCLIGIISTIIGVLPGIAAGKALSSVICGLLNFEILSSTVYPWVYFVLFFSGLFIPLLICLFPLIKSSRITVKEAISDTGITSYQTKQGFSFNILKKLPSILQMAIRNVFRKKKRLVLSLLLLSAAGGMFMASKNVDLAWDKKVVKVFNTRDWDLELQLTKMEDSRKISNVLLSKEEISDLKSSQLFLVTPYTDDQVRISEVYPDGGHGIFTLRGIDVNDNPYIFNILKGEIFEGDGTDQIILNQNAVKEFPGVNIGDEIKFNVNGQIGSWKLQGITEEIGPNGAYVSSSEVLSLLSLTNSANSYFIKYNTSTLNSESQFVDKIQSELESSGFKVKSIIPESMFLLAIKDHLFIILYAILGMGIILVIVGILGLSSSMSTSVIERKGEIGVLKTIGGSNRSITGSLILEGLLIAVISIIFAVLISGILSLIIGYNLGMMTFSVPLSLYLSPEGIFIWITILLSGAILATLFPALSAVELTVSKALKYE